MTTFKHASTTVERTRVFEVSDAPDMPRRYSDITIRPSEVVVEFRDGEFVRMVVKGANVKKDGTAGANSHDEAFWYREDVPDWAQPLTDPNFDGGV